MRELSSGRYDLGSFNQLHKGVVRREWENQITEEENMTPEEIINEMIKPLGWASIKKTNPEEYARLSKNVILSRFEKILPYFLKWQRQLGGYREYLKTLPSLSQVLESLDFKIYEQGNKGKQKLTNTFFNSIIPYGVENIINVSSSTFDEYRFLKVKNLINRSFHKFYSYRNSVINNITEILEWEKDTISQIEILNYIPFRNFQIGVDWMQRHANPTMNELLEDWLILLCFNVNMFLSDKFIEKLKKALGKEITIRLQKKLWLHIAKSEISHPIYYKIGQKYKRQILKYKELFNEGQIVEDIRFRDISFTKRHVCFYKYRMPIYPSLNPLEITYLQEIIDPCRLLTILVSYTPKNGVYTFRPIFAEDMEYMMMNIKKARQLAPTTWDEIDRKKRSSESNNLVNNTTKFQSKNSFHSTKYLRILATNVQAFQLKIKKGIIKYTTDKSTYVFRSVRIAQDVPDSVLERIEHYFTLVKDTTKILNGKKELRFYFEPANDLSFLLAEVERLSHDHHIETDETFPQSGEFEIPWRFVKFYDGTLTLFHPNPSRRGTYTPYYYRTSDILKSFEDIRPYIEKRSPNLRVQAVDGVITRLLNFKEFMSVVAQYKNWEKEEDIDFRNSTRPNKDVSKEIFARNPIIRKSPYLSYLSSLQHDDFTIKYLLERVIHESGQIDTDEYGYLFALKSTYYQIILLYENISDSSRSSILFYIDPCKYEEGVEIIRKFLASEITNKRQKLSYGQIRFNNPAIRMVKRIKHTDLVDWKYNLMVNL